MTLNTDPTESYGYTPYPADFEPIARELEAMAGCDVNVVVEHGYSSQRGTLRTSGRLRLAECADLGDEKRLRYAVGGDATFEISARGSTPRRRFPAARI
jgi:hypothetical protein